MKNKCITCKVLFEGYRINTKCCSFKCRKAYIRNYKLQYDINNKDEISKKHQNHYLKNKDKLKCQSNNYYHDNKDQYKKYRKNYKFKRNLIHKNRLKTEPLYKLRCNMSSMMYKIFSKNNYSKNSKTRQIVGCTYKELYSYLLKTFINRYNREPTNNEYIHIDHIIPLSSAINEEEIVKLNYYTNLQWLLAIDNLRKSDRLDWK